MAEPMEMLFGGGVTFVGLRNNVIKWGPVWTNLFASVCVCDGVCVWSDATVKPARYCSSMNTCLRSTAYNKTVK